MDRVVLVSCLRLVAWHCMRWPERCCTQLDRFCSTQGQRLAAGRLADLMGSVGGWTPAWRQCSTRPRPRPRLYSIVTWCGLRA